MKIIFILLLAVNLMYASFYIAIDAFSEQTHSLGILFIAFGIIGSGGVYVGGCGLVGLIRERFRKYGFAKMDHFAGKF